MATITNRIAIVGRDARIHVGDVNPDGGAADLRALTPPGMRCAWPAWSPDGNSLAYSAYPAAGGNGHGSFRVIAQPVSGQAYTFLGDEGRVLGFRAHVDEQARTIYVNEPGTDAIAPHTPHYLIWSPDGSKIALIAQRLAGLSLLVADARAAAAPVRMLDGGPLYFCWARDSRRILAHSRELHYLLELGSPLAAQVPVVSLGYMAPSASPAGEFVALCAEISADSQALLAARLDGGSSEMIAEIDGATGFSWSPDGATLAVARDLDRATGYYGRLFLIDLATGDERLLLTENALSFFWSPDGNMIAYIAPSRRAEGSVRWAVVDIASGARRYLPDFTPSQEQLIMFMFFDQYAQSHRVWSPDGRMLAFAGLLGRRQARDELPDGASSSVFAADIADGRVWPLGGGTLGVWSA